MFSYIVKFYSDNPKLSEHNLLGSTTNTSEATNVVISFISNEYSVWEPTKYNWIKTNDNSWTNGFDIIWIEKVSK